MQRCRDFRSLPTRVLVEMTIPARKFS
jgi:hypothetical protein